MERDPVCGLSLQPGQEEAGHSYQGQAYHFCSVECQRLFQQNPKEYVTEHPEAEPRRG